MAESMIVIDVGSGTQDIAVQDHGFSITESNRTLRFRLWEEFVRQGGDLHKLVFS